MTTPELLEFVRIEHALGMPLSEISRLLLVEGEWDAEDIAEAFVDLGLPTEAIYQKEARGVGEVIEVVEQKTEEVAVLAPAVELVESAHALAPVQVTPEITAAQVTAVPEVAPVSPVSPLMVSAEEKKEEAKIEVVPAVPPEVSVHPLMEAREIVSAPVLTRAVVKPVEEIFGSGPVVEPFGVGATVEPIGSGEGEGRVGSTEVEVQMKAEEERIATARAEEESRTRLAREAAEKFEQEKNTAAEKLAAEIKEAPAEDEAEKEIKAKIAEEKANADKEAREAAEVKARIEVEARMKAEDEARIKIEAEMKVRAEVAAKQALAGQMAQGMMSPAPLGVPMMAQTMAGQIPAQMQGMIQQVPIIYTAQMVAQGPTTTQPTKPAESLTPMRAITSSGTKPASKPIEPAKPAPVKFDISKLRAGEVKSGVPGQSASMLGAISGMQPVTAMSPEEFFKAQASGEGMGVDEGIAIARSLKVPHKRTMFGDIDRMQEGTLPAQVSGASISPLQEGVDEGDAAIKGAMGSEGMTTMGPTSALGEVIVQAPPTKTGSPWMVFIIALVFLLISGALAGYYYYFYRLPADAVALTNESIAITLAKDHAIGYSVEIKANLKKEGGEQLIASIKSSGTVIGNGKGLGDSDHHNIAANIDDSGISEPVSFHFNGEIRNVDGKYYFKPEQSAGTSDTLARTAGGWVTALPSELGVIIGLTNPAALTAGLQGAVPAPVSFYDTVMAHRPWKEIGRVERAGSEPVFLAPDEYSVPIALNPENMVALTDAFSVIIRGTEAVSTSDTRRMELIQRYASLSGSIIIDRKTHLIKGVTLKAHYNATSGSVGGDISLALTMDYPTAPGKIIVPPGSRTISDIHGLGSSSDGSLGQTPSGVTGTSSAPVVPIVNSTTTVPATASTSAGAAPVKSGTKKPQKR